MVSYVTCLTPLSELGRQQCAFESRVPLSIFFVLLVSKPFFRLTLWSHLRLETSELNGVTILPLAPSFLVKEGNCRISKALFVSNV